MAKERNLPSKTTLTTSDFIRIVGSDNASYKQSVSGVMDTMGVSDLNSMIRDVSWYRSANLNDFTTTGVYWIADAPTNAPSGWEWFSLAVMSKGDTMRQIATNADGAICVRVYQGSQGWRSWIQQPTRAEINALNSNLKRKVVTYRDITIPASGYVSLDSYASLGVNTSWYLFAMSIRGWSGDDAPRIIKGGSGTEFYAVGTPGTYSFFGVEYYFAVSVDTL